MLDISVRVRVRVRLILVLVLRLKLELGVRAMFIGRIMFYDYWLLVRVIG